MQTDDNNTDKRNATSHSTRNSEDEDIQAIAADLTKFQVRCLATIAQQDRYGLGIKREAETYYGEELLHGRLFPNLDRLVDYGLVEKGQRDRRTNNYAITEMGEDVLEYELNWLEEHINGGDGQ
ncbi:PadR family transcriptional regulator [Haloterrigena salifodinae]|uniref:PadR family transcriptional regulator n=1 Tax=Haloterrigena salifodinae TaxID=2675099 RepID=UPI000F876811|nr:PadR family transcriptional regulator [Haloterrigena salifodinae]